MIAVVKEYYDRLKKLEGEKYDLEYLTAKKDYEVRGDMQYEASGIPG